MAGNLERWMTGGVAGLLATVPMTLVMLAGKRLLPWRSREALPPTQITHNALAAVQLHDDVSHDERLALTALNHFAYGAAVGSLYGRLFNPRGVGGAAASGVGYGLTVWAGSYLGLMPALRLYRPPGDEPAERHGLIIAAHVVWGGSLGLLTLAMRPRRSRKERRKSQNTQRERLTAAAGS